MSVKRRIFSSDSAFTLIELLIVLGLLTLISATALPRLSDSIKHFRFTNDLANVEKLLRYGQYHAILEERIYKLELDQLDKTYMLYRQSDPEDFTTFEAVRVGTRAKRLFDNQTQFMGGHSEFFLFPDGTVTTPFRLALESTQGARVEITHTGLGLFKTTWQRE